MDLLLHAALMTIALLSMASGVAAAMFMRKKRWWLRYHQKAGMNGAVCLLIGLTAGIVMVFLDKEQHFKVVHSQLGAVTILLGCAAAILGKLQFAMKNRAQRLRIVHKWLGRTTMLFMPAVLILGLFSAGIL